MINDYVIYFADLKEKCKVRKFVTGPPPVDPTKCYVNQGEEDQMVIFLKYFIFNCQVLL
jgi:hypothetical protein